MLEHTTDRQADNRKGIVAEWDDVYTVSEHNIIISVR